MLNPALNQAYLVGIGGIGMSAIARYLHHQGWKVAGYDKTPSDITHALESLGVAISFDDNVATLPADFCEAANNTLVIYTPAVPRDSALLAYFSANNYERIKRAAALGVLVAAGKCLAVAGTHGKTTTSTMLAHLLTVGKQQPTAFLGGISSNYDSNLLLGNQPLFVVEADEFDRSFLQLHPQAAVITAMDADHLDIYGEGDQLAAAYNAFAAQVKTGGLLVYRAGLPIKLPADVKAIAYGDGGQVRAENIRISEHRYHFDYVGEVEIKDLQAGMPGQHNVENALAAITLALANGVTVEAIRNGIASFRGVKRRFEYAVNRPDCVYIDDYAHHPAEITALLTSVRQLYPGKKILGIFQPHLFSRTRDFAAAFAESLAALDALFLLDIYPARELPIAGINSSWLLNQVELEEKRLVQKAELLDLLRQQTFDVLLTIGAGDIDRFVRPITELLLQKSPVR
jgi:UDP-N-acetylmuramate--alanine ligase